MLEAAYEIVGQEGLEGLHARSVAAKVGVNHAAVHYYFAKRPDLILAVLEYALGRFSSDREKLLANATTPTDRLDAHLAQAEAYAAPGSRFVKNWVSFFVASMMDSAIRSELVRHLREWSVTLGLDLKEGLRTNGVQKSSPFIDPDILAATLLGLEICAQTIGPEFDMAAKLDAVAASLFG